MEENIYLFIGLIVALIVLFYPATKVRGEKNTAKSELHVHDRYEVAELIKKQWEERKKQ